MIWMFLLQLLLAVSAVILLKIQRVRNYLVAATALAGRITVHAANVIFYYLIACLVGLAIVSAGFFLGLLVRTMSPEFGNFIITASFLITAVALGIITLALTTITSVVANTVLRTRQNLAKASPATGQKLDWDGMFAKLGEQFPDKKTLLDAVQSAGKGWLANLFDTTSIRAILALPHNIAFDTIEAVTGVVSKILQFVVAALLWVAISGFVAMFLPDSAQVFWVVAIPYGLLILLAIAAYKGEQWCKDHSLPDLWWTGYKVVRWGVRFVVFAIIFTAIYAAINPPENLPHWVAGMKNSFRIKEEQSAKDYFGQNFDQRVCRVVAPVHGLYRQGGQFVQGEIIFPGTILWQDTESADIWTYRTKRYAKYYRQSPDGLHEPAASQEIFVPESAVCSVLELKTRNAAIDSGTVVHPDSLGVPAARRIPAPRRYEQLFVTEIQTQISGSVSSLCFYRERDKTKWVWVKERDLHFTTS